MGGNSHKDSLGTVFMGTEGYAERWGAQGRTRPTGQGEKHGQASQKTDLHAKPGENRQFRIVAQTERWGCVGAF